MPQKTEMILHLPQEHPFGTSQKHVCMDICICMHMHSCENTHTQIKMKTAVYTQIWKHAKIYHLAHIRDGVNLSERTLVVDYTISSERSKSPTTEVGSITSACSLRNDLCRYIQIMGGVRITAWRGPLVERKVSVPTNSCIEVSHAGCLLPSWSH